MICCQIPTCYRVLSITWPNFFHDWYMSSKTQIKHNGNFYFYPKIVIGTLTRRKRFIFRISATIWFFCFLSSFCIQFKQHSANHSTFQFICFKYCTGFSGSSKDVNMRFRQNFQSTSWNFGQEQTTLHTLRSANARAPKKINNVSAVHHYITPRNLSTFNSIHFFKSAERTTCMWGFIHVDRHHQLIQFPLM